MGLFPQFWSLSVLLHWFQHTNDSGFCSFQTSEHIRTRHNSLLASEFMYSIPFDPKVCQVIFLCTKSSKLWLVFGDWTYFLPFLFLQHIWMTEKSNCYLRLRRKDRTCWISPFLEDMVLISSLPFLEGTTLWVWLMLNFLLCELVLSFWILLRLLHSSIPESCQCHCCVLTFSAETVSNN